VRLQKANIGKLRSKEADETVGKKSPAHQRKPF